MWVLTLTEKRLCDHGMCHQVLQRDDPEDQWEFFSEAFQMSRPLLSADQLIRKYRNQKLIEFSARNRGFIAFSEWRNPSAGQLIWQADWFVIPMKVLTRIYTAVQSLMAVSAQFKSKQILPFGFAEQHSCVNVLRSPSVF